MNINNSFYMPAEWEKHEGTLICWPVKSSMIWPAHYEEFCRAYADIIDLIKDFEKVIIIINEGDEKEVKRLCGEDVQYLQIPHNDAWCRDNGPSFVIDKDNHLKAVNWRFNAWGEKYHPYDSDNLLAPDFLDFFKIQYFNSPLILEGGSIHVNGSGLLLTTEECLLNSNRNANFTQEKIEDELKKKLGARKIIWLKKGLTGDETDGHVDNLACFVKPTTILIQSSFNSESGNYERSKENFDILNNSTDIYGEKIKIIEIPEPPIRYFKDQLLPLSYLNFYFINGGIILPVFGGDARDFDQEAERILKDLFPDREILKIDGIPLIKEGGNVHCITQQIPVSTKKDWRR